MPSAEDLDGIWISHEHADHTFGIPFVLGRMLECRRRKPLAILGQRGVLTHVEQVMDVAYGSLRSVLPFRMREVPVEPGRARRWRGLTLRSAETGHGRRNLALRVSSPGVPSVTYSGDGPPTEASAELGRGAWWIHECFTRRGALYGHCDLETLAAWIPRVEPLRLGLVHASESERAGILRGARALRAAGHPVRMLRDGDAWEWPA